MAERLETLVERCAKRVPRRLTRVHCDECAKTSLNMLTLDSCDHAPRNATTASRVVPSSQSSTPPSRGSVNTNVDSEEDTAYLRTLTLLRESRQSEARLAAQDVLRKFPFGFRNVEVERVAR